MYIYIYIELYIASFSSIHLSIHLSMNLSIYPYISTYTGINEDYRRISMNICRKKPWKIIRKSPIAD